MKVTTKMHAKMRNTKEVSCTPESLP